MRHDVTGRPLISHEVHDSDDAVVDSFGEVNARIPRLRSKEVHI